MFTLFRILNKNCNKFWKTFLRSKFVFAVVFYLFCKRERTLKILRCNIKIFSEIRICKIYWSYYCSKGHILKNTALSVTIFYGQRLLSDFLYLFKREKNSFTFLSFFYLQFLSLLDKKSFTIYPFKVVKRFITHTNGIIFYIFKYLLN